MRIPISIQDLSNGHPNLAHEYILFMDFWNIQYLFFVISSAITNTRGKERPIKNNLVPHNYS